MKLRKITITDLAKKTGYSIATVSRALNNFPTMNPKTRANIQEMARKMNYIPNLSARNLVKQDNKTIGLLAPENNQFYYEFYLHLQKMALEKGYHVIISYSNHQATNQRFHINRYLQLKVAGIIIAPVVEAQSILGLISSSLTPFVTLNNFDNNHKDTCILFNFKKGTEEAIRALLLKGKSNLWHLTKREVYYGRSRRNVFKLTLEASGKPYDQDRILYTDDTLEDGYNLMKKALDSKKPIDGVVCSSDYTAIGAMRAIVDAGKKVPEEIAIVGCYNTQLSTYSTPRLSTIETDIKQIATLCLNKVLDEIESNKKSEMIEIQTSFIERETT